MGKQKHHVTPLSLGGRDVKQNWLYLEKDDHRLVHDTLDIPYNTVRKYRAVMNQNLFNPTEKMARAQARIESLFFSRLSYLPNRLQKAIKDKVEEDSRDMYKEHGLNFPEVKGNLITAFKQILNARKELYLSVLKKPPNEAASQAI